ncbi:MAG TPA: hypothetical protein VGT24_10480 [Candidatus Acidoferrales bacterium]|nr:hypothetical protein [Candidatus Acidoferrales bacterium]
MRVFAAVLLSIGLAASPLLARNADETAKEETAAAAKSPSAVPDKPVPVKAESSAIESEMQELRSLVEEQRAELEAQRAALKTQQLKMEALEEKLGAAPSEPASAPVATSAAITATTPASPVGVTAGTPAATATAAMKPQKEGESPLYFKIGGAEFYPLGFMDMTGFYRSTDLGGIGTSFGSIPYGNTVAGRLSEFRFSAQNSRIGLRTHAKFGPADVTGYLESDFLGYSVPNLDITSNSDTLRLRLYWVDAKQGKIEVLGGQTWSFMTPNRVGLSALPGDLFYGQEMDTNYQLGLTWARQTAFRVILHPNNNWALGVSLENPQQTLPTSVSLPPGVTTGYGGQLDTNSGNTSDSVAVNNPNAPNLHPDVIVKTAFDAAPGGHHVHFDVAGLFRTFKALNTVQTPSSITAANSVTTTIHGGGGEIGLNLELIKNLRLIGTAYYGYAGGRYIASTGGPDVIVKPDGTLSGIHSGSAIGGFEWQINPKTMLYAYGSGAYFGNNVVAATATVNTPATGTATGTCTVTTNYGYGFGPGTAVLATGTGTCSAPAASKNSNNRFLYEPTAGIIQTLWRNPSYGDLKIITQYSIVNRAPWFVGTNPSSAHNNMVYIDLRYDLP